MNPLPPALPPIEEWHLVSQAPWGRWGMAVGACAALAAVALVYLGTRRRPTAQRRAIVALRAGATAASLVLFLQPALELQEVLRRPNHVAVLVDGSASMALRESSGEKSRSERAAARIAAAHTLFDRWRGEHRLDFFLFNRDLTPIDETSAAHPLNTDGTAAEATHLGEAIGALRGRYAPGDLGGVVVVSDGIDNGRFGEAGAELDAVGRDMVRSLDAPVHAVWTGHAGLRDLAVARVLADDFAFARNAVKVEAVVRVSGASAAGWSGKRVPITLRRDGAVVKTIDLTVDAKRPEQRVTFEFAPDRVGKYLYEIEAPVLPGEALAENNARAFVLNVIREKIRVLLVAGRPSWDERFLRGLLKHDPNVDLISFFILRTPTDVEAVSPSEMSLIPFPTEELFLEQLRSFDVVFLQNFNYGPYGIGAYLPEIRHYVEEGGGLAMIGGDLSFSSGGYFGSPIADVLPMELVDPSGPSEKLIAPEPFRLSLTADGRNHPITSARGDDAELHWSSLPPLEGANLVAGAKPGATVLGVHPFLKGRDGRPLPILAVSEVGKGRSLALTTDSSWRWGFGALGAATGNEAQSDLRGRHYQRFWQNAIRWLIHDPELRFLRIECDQSEYRRGEKVHLRVRASNTDYRPLKNASIAVRVLRLRDLAHTESVVVEKTVRTDDEGEAQLELESLAPGGYRAIARRVENSPNDLQDDEPFVVRAGSREEEDPEARDGLLRAVASAGGGRFVGPKDSLDDLSFRPPEVVRLSRHRDVELWSTWLTLLVAAACLGGEWILRRRWGLA